MILAESCEEYIEPLRFDCVLDSVGLMGDATLADPSPGSERPVHALYTTSRMDGVNKDSVRCESVRAARRSKFFCENREWVSTPDSSDSDAISDAFKAFPKASTGSWGGLAKGSWPGPSVSTLVCSSSRSRYSGTHSRKDSRWMITGSSSINKTRS